MTDAAKPGRADDTIEVALAQMQQRDPSLWLILRSLIKRLDWHSREVRVYFLLLVALKIADSKMAATLLAQLHSTMTTAIAGIAIAAGMHP